MNSFIRRRLFEVALVVVALAAYGLYELFKWLTS
jgi:hypothetical protein